MISLIPDFIRTHSYEDLGEKITFGYSNVPGPKEPYVIAGKNNHALGFTMPVGKSAVGSFAVISHADSMKICLMVDKASMKSTKPIRELLMHNLDAMLGK